MTVSSCTTHSLVRDLEQPIDEAARLNATIITTVIEANLHPPKSEPRWNASLTFLTAGTQRPETKSTHRHELNTVSRAWLSIVFVLMCQAAAGCAGR